MTAEHHGPELDARGEHRVIACEPCGFRHALPLPTPSEHAAIYEDAYYEEEKPDYLERARADLEWWRLTYADRYDAFAEHLPAERRRLLDVGSGPGFFLEFGRDQGWTVQGIEPARQACEHTRSLGVEVQRGFLNAETAAGLSTFDVVHMHHVLEHIPDPADMLSLAHGLLAPGGLIALIVPNDYSPFQEVARDACGLPPWWVAPPHHLNYFDFESLPRLAERAGFEQLELQTTFPIDLFLLMGDPYVGDDALGRICHGKRKQFEANLAAAGKTQLRRDLYRALAGLGIGRDVVYLGRRRDG